MSSSDKENLALALVSEHYSEWQIPQETGDLIARVIQEQALLYRTEKGLPSFKDGGLDLAVRIVSRAFVEGVRATQQEIPVKKGKIKEAISSGFLQKKQLFEKAQVLIDAYDQDHDVLADLGFDHEQLNSAKKEFHNQTRVIWPETSSHLVEKSVSRANALDSFSTALLVHTWTSMGHSEDEMSKERVKLLLYQSHLEALLVRQSLLSTIGGLVDLDINPLFATYENVSAFAQRLEKLNDLPEGWPDYLIERYVLMFAGDDPNTVQNCRELVGAYLSQITKVFGTWLKMSGDRDLVDETPEYWQRMHELFSAILPMSPIAVDVDFIINPNLLSQAISENKPHLWQDPIFFEGKALPSIKGIYRAMQIFSVNRQKVGPVGMRLISAEISWKEYLKVTTQYPDLLSQMKDRMEDLEKIALNDVVLTDYEMNSQLTFMGASIASTDRALKHHQRILEEYETLQGELETGQVDQDAQVMWDHVVNRAFEKLIRHERQLVGLLDDRSWKAFNEFGWWNFSASGEWVEPELKNKTAVGAERERLRDLLLQSSDGIPAQIADIPQQEILVKFFRRWRSSLSTIAADGWDGRKHAETLRFIDRAEKYIDSPPLLKSFLSAWYMRSMANRVEVLDQQMGAYAQLDLVRAQLDDFRMLLSGEIDAEVLARVNEYIDIPDPVLVRQYVQLRLLPKDVRDNLHEFWVRRDELLDPLDELIRLSTVHHTFRFTLTSKESLDSVLEHQLTRKPAEKAGVRRMIELFGELRDHPLMPWEFEGELSRTAFIDALRFRVDVVKALLAEPYLVGELERKRARRDEFKQKLLGVAASKEWRMLTQRSETLEEDLTKAEERLIAHMESLGLVAQAELFS